MKYESDGTAIYRVGSKLRRVTHTVMPPVSSKYHLRALEPLEKIFLIRFPVAEYRRDEEVPLMIVKSWLLIDQYANML